MEKKYFIDSRYFMLLQKTAYLIIYSGLKQLIISFLHILSTVAPYGSMWTWSVPSGPGLEVASSAFGPRGL